MECHSCHHENPSSSKYCSQCGTALSVACPACNHLNQPGNRFCNQCGGPLPTDAAGASTATPAEANSSPSSIGERRWATIVFADLSGYTTMGEKLDPEEVESCLNRIKQGAKEIITFHGGTTNRFLGDEIMALFGIPVAHEDDPVRAVRAVIAVHQMVRGIGADLNMEQRIGQFLTMHSGIESGLIVSTYQGGLDGLYAITGDAANTSARLRALADVDEIIVGPATQNSLVPYIETVPLDPVVVKGKAGSMTPHKVIRESEVQTRFDAAEKRGFTRYAGREQELGALCSCLEQAQTGAGQLVTIEGDAGVGKSRLLYEFRHRLDRSSVALVEGRCQSYGSDTPYLPLIDALRRGLGLADQSDESDPVAKTIENVRNIDPELEQYIPLYLNLLSIPSELSIPKELSGKELRKAMQEAFTATIIKNTRHRACVLIFEDWHWCDEASDLALKHLIQFVAPHPLMVVVTHRTGHSLNWLNFGNHQVINLKPLGVSQTESIIQSLTSTRHIPDGLCAIIQERTGGNPLFIEEACYALLESGALVVKEERLVPTQDLNDLPLPDTIQAIIRTRLDRLDNSARQVARLASVIGRQFAQKILEQLYREREPLIRGLDTLKQQELIQQTRPSPEIEYIFKHVLMREVAYETLLKTMRLKLHADIGDALERLYPERTEEHTDVLAYHYVRSERYDKAIHYSFIAGDRAARLYANTEAVSHLQAALKAARALPSSPAAQRYQIDAMLKLAPVESGSKDIDQERSDLEQALELSRGLKDDNRTAQILYWLGRVHYTQGSLRPAIEYAQLGLSIADRLGDQALAAPPVNLIGRAYWQLSDFVNAALYMERSIQDSKKMGDQTEECTAAGFTGALIGYLGDFDRAIEYAELSVDLAAALSNPFAEAASHHYRGIIEDQLGRWSSALAAYDRAKAISAKNDDVFRIYLVTFMQGRAHTFAGDTALGLRQVREGINIARDIGTKFILSQALSALATCHRTDGNLEQALTAAIEAIQLADETGDRFSEALAQRTHGEVLATSGQDGATEALLGAIQIQEEIGVKPELARSYASFAQILDRAGEPVDGERYRADAADLFQQLGMLWDLEQLNPNPGRR